MGGFKDPVDLQYGLQRLDHEIELFGRAFIGDDPHGPPPWIYTEIARDVEEMQLYVARYFERNVRSYLGRGDEADRSSELMEVILMEGIGGRLRELNDRLNELFPVMLDAGGRACRTMG